MYFSELLFWFCSSGYCLYDDDVVIHFNLCVLYRRCHPPTFTMSTTWPASWRSCATPSTCSRHTSRLRITSSCVAWKRNWLPWTSLMPLCATVTLIIAWRRCCPWCWMGTAGPRGAREIGSSTDWSWRKPSKISHRTSSLTWKKRKRYTICLQKKESSVLWPNGSVLKASRLKCS